MIGITENRLAITDVMYALNITRDIYDLAVDSGVMPKGDVSQGMVKHSFSDLLTFSVALAHGWPVIPFSTCADEVEAVLDIISYSWEKSYEEQSSINNSELSNTCLSHDSAFLFSKFAHLEVSNYASISDFRKKALVNYINLAVSLAHIFSIRDSIAGHRRNEESAKQSFVPENSKVGLRDCGMMQNPECLDVYRPDVAVMA